MIPDKDLIDLEPIFDRHCDCNSGDYTKERKKTLGKKTAKQIGEEILELQKSL